ncbi:MAG: thioredoxin TrxC [Alphaproteobacteria bacterium]|nr:thioredoxin TrxC [Alphaproteobacteria bacterium]
MGESNHVVCTACGAINRLASGHDAHAAKCGKCAAVLFSGEPAEVTASQFDRQIAKSDIPVLVDVWAPWCGPCRVMGPQFAAAAVQAEPAMRFIKLNSDAAPELSTRLSIRSIPTMLMFQNGKEIGRVSGAMSSTDILKWAASVHR